MRIKAGMEADTEAHMEMDMEMDTEADMEVDLEVGLQLVSNNSKVERQLVAPQWDLRINNRQPRIKCSNRPLSVQHMVNNLVKLNHK